MSSNENGLSTESAPSEKLSGAEADPLQGAADWFKEAIVDCDVADIQSRLLIGYNRAKRLFDAASHAETVPHVPAGQGEQS